MGKSELIRYAGVIDRTSSIVMSLVKQLGFPNDAYKEDLEKLEEIERWLLDLAAEEIRKENRKQ